MEKKDKRAADPYWKMREDLMEVSAFRSFIVSLMVKCRYLKKRLRMDDFECGQHNAYSSIIEDFVLGTDNGEALVKEYLEFIKTDKKEY